MKQLLIIDVASASYFRLHFRSILQQLHTLKHFQTTEFYAPTDALLYTIKYQSKMFILKTLKNAPTCFYHHSDHLQGARMFLVKVTDC